VLFPVREALPNEFRVDVRLASMRVVENSVRRCMLAVDSGQIPPNDRSVDAFTPPEHRILTNPVPSHYFRVFLAFIF